jgi:peptidoglycan/xylan/chitin deacetylase (PgdA/CDA1 family)
MSCRTIKGTMSIVVGLCAATMLRVFPSLILTLFVLVFALALDSGPLASLESEPEAPVFDGTLRRIYVPILMYHYVGELPEDADVYRTDLTVDPAVFRAHIAYLHSEGYQTISMYDLYAALMHGAALPPRPIILTFDDGYIDHYEHVFPILREFGFTGTFFIITATADNGNSGYLNWQQIQEMAAAGMDMESHTKNHIDLRDRDHDRLVYEILGSFESLRAHTGHLTRMFAYPGGRYDELTLDILERLQVWGAVTTQFGAYHTTDSALELPRLRVSRDMGAAGLAHLLRSSG